MPNSVLKDDSDAQKIKNNDGFAIAESFGGAICTRDPRGCRTAYTRSVCHLDLS